MISREDIDRIMDAVRIEEVVGDFVELKRRGAGYIGLCPFHNEKTPSFNVSPARGIFKCFGCGEGGDAVSFLMKHQSYSYPEALRYLAKKYGIEIHEKEISQEEIEARDEKDVLYNINELACNHFYENLMNTEEGKAIGLTYFNEREIAQKTIDTWRLGYSKQKSDDFYNYAKKAGYKDEDLVKSGLCLKSEKDGTYYDRFRSRVTFPIYNAGGRVLGFSARILSNDKNKAKYVNSPESPIYTKGRTLFGLNFARSEMAKQDFCYLVEGNIDAIMMNQNDVKNVVASSGTALTEDQVHLIKRFTRNVVVLYDGDAAGIHAAIRATDMFLKEGMHISIVLFPDGDDPDSFARKHTQDEFKTFLKDNSQNFIIYRANLLKDSTLNDPIKKATLVHEILHSISLIPDAIERTTYISQCADILDMKEETLTAELQKEIIHSAFVNSKHDTLDFNPLNMFTKQRTESHQTIEQRIGKDTTDIRRENLERNLLRILVTYSTLTTNQPVLINNEITTKNFNAAEFILGDMISSDIDIKNPLYKEVFDMYFDAYKQSGVILSSEQIIRTGSEDVKNLVSTLLIEQDNLVISDGWEKYGMLVPDIHSQNVIDEDIKQVTLRIKLMKVKEHLEEIKQTLKDNPDDMSAMENYSSLLLISQSIAKELSQINL